MIIIICILIVCTIFFGDMWIKNSIEKNIPEGKTIKKWKGRLFISKHHNKGAMLNFGQSKRQVVVLVSLILSTLLLFVFIFTLGQKGKYTLKLALSLLLGGAFSNTYDRLKRKYVVDYVSFNVKWKKLRNVIFNISDFCIIIGALILSICSYDSL